MFRKSFIYSSVVASFFILQSSAMVSAAPLNCIVDYICVDSGERVTSDDRAYCRGVASVQYSTGIVMSPETFATAAIPVDPYACPKVALRCKLPKENWPCVGINQKVE